MSLLVKLLGVQRFLRLASSLVTVLPLLHSLPDDGQITACDIDEDFTSIAQKKCGGWGFAEN